MYWNGCAGPLNDQQWVANMAAIDAWKLGNGGADTIASFSRSFVAHFWDLSDNTGSDLWNRFGFRYITSIQKPGYQSTLNNGGADRLPVHAFWHREIPPKAPVNPNLPTETYPFFFADDYTVNSRAGLPAQTFFLFGTQYFDLSKYSRPDFEWPSAVATPVPTVASSIAQLKQYTWRHWSGLSPLQLFTHDSLNFEYSTAVDRQGVVAQSSKWLNANGARHVFMDELGDYIYARNKSRLSAAQYTAGQLNYTFTGSAASADGQPVSTQVLLFQADDDGVWQNIAGFTNGLQVTAGLPPSILSVSPASGSTSGGTAVTITGTSLTPGSSVYFGQSAAAIVSASGSALNVTTPAGPAGSADIRVVTPNGTALLSGGYTYANSCPCSIWPPSTTPSIVDSNDSNSVELGVRFRSDVSGSITGLRFHKSAANAGTHLAHLWTNTGTLLASATFTNESPSGWQQVTFPIPVAISAGTTYVASYFAPNGHYSLNPGYFTVAGADNPPLHFLQDGIDGSNGSFVYSPTGGFPNTTFNAGNYWVDVVFSTTGGFSGPSVTLISPVAAATGVSVNAIVSATFDRALDPATVTNSTFRLLDSANAAVPATVSYNAPVRQITLTPASSLAYAGTYTAVITGGTNGVKDTSGNALAADYLWTFTTVSDPTRISLWTPTTTPAVVDSNDPAAVQLGVRFRSDVAGAIVGIRFYKALANTGVHIGYLWSNTGTLLGTAVFSGETASGWQQVTFPGPIGISANTTYVASYLAPNGHYSVNAGYFASAGADNAPLHFLKDGLDGPNAPFIYGTSGGFPTDTFSSSNYWVDVILSTVQPPSITAQPASAAINSGQTATLTVIATGAAPLTYQWFLGNSGDTAQPVAGATSSSYTTPALTTTRSYWVRVMNGIGSASSNTATLTVNRLTTVTSLNVSPNPAVAGQTVTLTATVTAGATGTVTFLDGTATLGTSPLVSGTATLATSQLAVGSHSLTATYSGDPTFAGSTSASSTLAVNLIATKTTLTASPNPSVTGQSVTLSAAVSPVEPGSGTVAGSVTFNDGAAVLGTATLSGGSASLAVGTLAAGSHSLSATYTPDGNYAGSTSTAVTQTVNKASTTTTVTNTPSTAVFGQSVILSATVSPVAPGSGTVTGSVTFNDGTTVLGTATLSSGSASLPIATLTLGSHSLKVTYAATDNYAGSASSNATQTVNKSPTTTTFTITPEPSVFTQSITLTATVAPVAPGAGTPTGTVSLLSGSTVLGSGTLSGGTVSQVVSTLPVGSYSFTVSYSGDANFNSSASPAVAAVVNQASSTTVLVTSPNPSVPDQSVTLTATVAAASPATGTPTGSVTFRDGSTTLASVALSNGTAAFSLPGLALGSHSLTVVYGGSGDFKTSTSTAVTQTVNRASTTTALTASPNPTTSGQSVTLTATVAPVAPGTGTPGGTITYRDGTTVLGTATLASGHATLSVSSLTAGAHSLTAEYGGAQNYAPSSSATVTQTVNIPSTTTALTATPNPSTVGQTVTLKATVSVVSPGTGTPTGTVSFKDGSTVLGTGTLSSGTVSLTTSTLTQGAHSLTVVYSGATGYSGSTSTALTQTVNPAATTTVLTSSLNPSNYGQSTTLRAVVSPVSPATGTPTGTVTFRDGSTTIATATLSGGAAVAAVATLISGSHSLTAVYNGAGDFAGSISSTVTQTVNKATTVTVLNLSSSNSVYGQPVTLTATISSSIGGMTGTVTFRDGLSTIGTGTVSGGVATLLLTTLSVTTHLLSANYNGDNNFASDGSPIVLSSVSQASSTTKVLPSVNPSQFGQSVTLVATVSPVAPSVGLPTGSVTFRDGGSALATVTLANGTASLPISSLSVGSHSITAVYNDDSNFLSSTSVAFTQAVNQTATTTTLTATPNPSNFGQTVAFKATVSPVSPGGATPTGTVVFRDGSTTIGTVSLSGGIATLNTSSLSRTTHTITAVYQSTTSYGGSTSTGLTQTVR